MDKNWLIRTKSCHILGPVSRDKVIELFKNGSIKPEDEICSGNGHWIWLRETDLVERYLLIAEKQSFNPISEAPTLFGDLPTNATEYSDDITLITGRTQLEPAESSSTMAKPADRPATPAKVESIHKPVKREYVSAGIPVSPGKSAPKRRAVDDVRPVKVLRPRGLVSDRTFMIVSLLALMALAVIFYYRKRIINEFAQAAFSVIIPQAVAQDSVIKKKTSSLKF